MIMMMGMMKNKNGPSSRQQELFNVLNQQEEKMKMMLEEMNNKKSKEERKAKNEAMMERLFQIEDRLLNQMEERPGRNPIKKVDFTELMKGQQLYQKQLIDTLIMINKKPKNTVKPTVYIPVPVRDPNLLPHVQEDSTNENTKVKASGKKTKNPATFGDDWNNLNTAHAGLSAPSIPANVDAQPGPPSNTIPIQASQPVISIKPTSRPGSSRLPPIASQMLGSHSPNYYQPQMTGISAQGGATPFLGMQGSLVGSSPNLGLPTEMHPNVLRIYKRKKGINELTKANNKAPRTGPYRISKLRKYAIAAHFIKKLWINQVKANQRYRKESRIFFEENVERIYIKTTKFLRHSLSDVLDKLWNLEVPLSITRRKKLYVMYGIDTVTMGPFHWEQLNLILMGILEELNKFCNEEFLDPDVVNFFSKYSCNRAFLKDNFHFESMLDRLEFDSYEGLL
jgi:hypothetical protein